jgi:hypothetical protein
MSKELSDSEIYALRKFANAEQLKVLDAYHDQCKIVGYVQRFMRKVGKLIPREENTTEADKLLSQIFQSEITELEQELAEDFPFLAGRSLEFKLEKENSYYMLSYNEFGKDILDCRYGEALRLSEIINQLLPLQEADKKREQLEYEQRQIERRKNFYVPFDIVRADYDKADVTPMTPTELRDSGLIPKGYELVPVDLLAMLVWAGEDAYSLAVAPYAKEVKQASNAGKNILGRRQFQGKSKPNT